MGYLWEEDSDELSQDGGVPELIGFQARTLSELGTSLDSGLGRVTSFFGTRSLIGFVLWELSELYLRTSTSQNFTGTSTLSLRTTR